MAGTENLYDRIARNRRNSYILIAAITLIYAAVGYAAGRAFGNAYIGLAAALVIAALQTAIAFGAGDDILLSLSSAKEIQKQDNPVLFDVVEEMAIAAGLPTPRVFIMDDPSPNAFATGKDEKHSAVAVTTGLLAKLDREELQGVLGHEMSHVQDHDILFSMLIGIMVGSIALLCDGARLFGYSRDNDERGSNAIFLVIFLVLSIVAPIAALLIQMAVSRQREFLADAEGARLTRNPLGLARALEKISSDPEPTVEANRATQHLYIVNPLKSANEDSPSLFDTHPPTGERIRVLRGMAHA